MAWSGHETSVYWQVLKQVCMYISTLNCTHHAINCTRHALMYDVSLSVALYITISWVENSQYYIVIY